MALFIVQMYVYACFVLMEPKKSSYEDIFSLYHNGSWYRVVKYSFYYLHTLLTSINIGFSHAFILSIQTNWPEHILVFKTRTNHYFQKFSSFNDCFYSNYIVGYKMYKMMAIKKHQPKNSNIRFKFRQKSDIRKKYHSTEVFEKKQDL